MKYTLDLDFRNDPINAAITLALYLIFGYIVFQLIKKLLGGSWDLDIITLSLLGGLILNEIRKEYRLGLFIGEMREFKKACIQNLSRINNKLFEEKAD